MDGLGGSILLASLTEVVEIRACLREWVAWRWGSLVLRLR